MSTERPAARLRDILDNVDRIREHTRDMGMTAFTRDRKTVDAVERCLERIAEATRKLGDRYDASYPELDLPALRRLGSVLRHDYDAVSPERLWATVENRLDSLADMARKELGRLQGED